MFTYRKLIVLSALIFCSLPLYGQAPSIQAILNAVNADSAVYFVKELSGVVPVNIGGTQYTIASRNKGYAGNDQAGLYIKQKLESYGIPAVIQTFSTTGKNVIGTQAGTEFPNKKYMICGHFDSMPAGATAPGADDNASGTAAVLEAARVFSRYQFPFTIVYALWDEEEQGLVGSNYYATQAAAAGDSILGVINLDMIAWDSNNDNVVEVHTKALANSLTLSAKMVELNQVYQLGLQMNVINPGITASDHASFWNKNYSSILLIEQYNGDFNAYYHTVNDVVARYNQPYFVKCIKAAFATLAHFAMNLNMQLQHTPIASTAVVAPITTSAVVSTSLAIATGAAAPRLWYRAKQTGGWGQWSFVTGTAATESATYQFTIPAQPMGSLVQYYIAAQDANATLVVTLPAGGSGFNPPGATPPQTFYQFYVAGVNAVFADSANSPSLWSVAGTWGTTSTKFVSAPYSFTESPAGTYGNGVTATCTTLQPINLSASVGAMLEFDAQWDIESNYDYCQIQLSTNNGTTWLPLQGLYTNPGTGSFQPNGEPLYDATQATWVHERIDLSAYTGQQIKLRFFFRTDNSQVADGFYFDNLTVLQFSAVPVEFTSFSAAVQGSGCLLNWATATETNNRGFSIERSADNASWSSIGFVPGGGTTALPAAYAFTDRAPLRGVNYYRVKQVDYDGTVDYSATVMADFTLPAGFVLLQNYPNPFNPATAVTFSLPRAAHITLAVYDLLGREQAVLASGYHSAGWHTVQFNAASMASGSYVCRLTAPGSVLTKKMVLLK